MLLLCAYSSASASMPLKQLALAVFALHLKTSVPDVFDRLMGCSPQINARMRCIIAVF
jgi:hypothetical protein